MKDYQMQEQKTMANYSESEIRAFKKKDLLNSRMSALKAVSVIHEGSAKKAKTVLKEADEYFDWVQQDQTVSEPKGYHTPDEDSESKKQETETAPPSDTQKSIDSSTLPKPNLAQKKVLDVISDRLGARTQQEKVMIVKSVLRWSFAVHDGSKVLPSRMSSVDEFLAWLKENATE